MSSIKEELTEDAIKRSRSYIARTYVFKRSKMGTTSHPNDTRQLIGYFGIKKDISVWEGDVVQMGSIKNPNGDYYQIRWDEYKHWYYASIIQSSAHPNWVTLDFVTNGRSINSGKPYSFESIYRAETIA